MQGSSPDRSRLPDELRRVAGEFADRLAGALSRPLVALVVVVAMVAVSVAFAVHGLRTPLRTDYVALLTGARVVGQGGCLYCLGAQAHAQAALVGVQGAPLDAFLETPLWALAYRSLLGLPPSAGFAVFLALSAVCLAATGHLLWRRLGLAAHGAAGAALLALTLVSLPAAWNYQLGQIDGVLVLPLVGGAVLLATNRRFAGGILLSLLLLKPQTVWLLPVALLVAGEWEAVAGMALGGVCLAGASLWLIGTSGVGQWLALLGSRGPALSTSDGLPGAIASLGGNGAGFVAAATLGLVACGWLWWHRRSLAGRPLEVVVLGVACSLLFAPHVYVYDMILVTLPLAVMARRSLAAALAAALLLNAAYLVDTYFIYEGPHLEALALCVIVALLAAGLGDRSTASVARPAPAQVVASSTTTGA